MTNFDPAHESLRLERLQAAQVQPLRTRILRPHFRAGQLGKFAEDDDAETAHFGLIDHGQDVVAVVTFLPRDCPHPDPAHPDAPALQLRGMAVAERMQRRGLGARLIDGALGRLALIFPEVETVWCNARISAATFYEKMGFERVGEVFEVENIGPHVVMRRKLAVALAE